MGHRLSPAHARTPVEAGPDGGCQPRTVSRALDVTAGGVARTARFRADTARGWESRARSPMRRERRLMRVVRRCLLSV